MASTLNDKIDLFLRSNIGRRFTAKEIAQHLIKIYPDEYRVKLERSTKLTNIDSLITQIAVEIGSGRVDQDSRFPHISRELGENRKFYYTVMNSSEDTTISVDGFRTDEFARTPVFDASVEDFRTDEFARTPVFDASVEDFRTDEFARTPMFDASVEDFRTDEFARTPVIDASVDGFRTDEFARTPVIDASVEDFRTDEFARTPVFDASVEDFRTDEFARGNEEPASRAKPRRTYQPYKGIDKYRGRLLDTSRKNNLISLAHTASSYQHIRVVDEVPEFLYKTLLDGKQLTLKSLPEDDNTPSDEKTERFLHIFKQRQLTDKEYLDATEAIDENEEGYASKIQQAERALRNKVRQELGLPEWSNRKTLTNVEIAEKHGIDPSYYLHPRNAGVASKKHSDKYVQTLLKPEEMSSKLSKMNSAINNDISSSGVNTFYIAFGFLRWYDSEALKKPYTSPLVLLQLEMTKKKSSKGFVYQLQSVGEEPQVNLSLIERLKDDFGMQIPELKEDQPLESYLSSVSACISRGGSLPGKSHWRVYRFVTLGRFHFARLVMYHDLSQDNWSKRQNPAAAEIIKKLLVGSDDLADFGYAKDYSIDTPEVDKDVPLLVTPADASQHSAIVDAMKGKSMVIQGPPGTGKSQTITNIIANALYKGKTVLFLAEKMAALNVVYERLNHASLGDFCLELHSAKAKKVEVIRSIKKRLDLEKRRAIDLVLAQEISERKRQRDIVTKYVDAVNSTLDEQKRTNHEYLWALQLRQGQLGELTNDLNIIKPTLEEAKQEELELVRTTTKLKEIAHLKSEVDKVLLQGVHPWSFVQVFDQTPFQISDLKDALKGWADQLHSVADAYKNVAPTLYQNGSTTFEAVGRSLLNTKGIAEVDVASLDLSIMEHLGSSVAAKSFVSLVDKWDARNELLQQIGSIQDPARYMNHAPNIRTVVDKATKAGVQNLTAKGIADKIDNNNVEVSLWASTIPDMKKASMIIGLESEGMTLKRTRDLIAIIQDVASTPRELLLARSPSIINESNCITLEQAVKTKSYLDEQVAKQGKMWLVFLVSRLLLQLRRAKSVPVGRSRLGMACTTVCSPLGRLPNPLLFFM